MKKLHYLFGSSNLKIYQDPSVFSFSLDSILLGHFVNILPSCKKILDIGCGNAPISLILSERTAAHITGIEIQKQSCLLANESILENQKESQIKVIEADINEFYKQIESDTFDVIVCNPPYFVTYNPDKQNQQKSYTVARHEGSLKLEQIFKISKKILKNNGSLAIVHRPDRFIDILSLMRKYGIEPKRIQFVYPRHNQAANTILIEGRKSGKVGLKIEPPLFVHNLDGSYTEALFHYIGGAK